MDLHNIGSLDLKHMFNSVVLHFTLCVWLTSMLLRLFTLPARRALLPFLDSVVGSKYHNKLWVRNYYNCRAGECTEPYLYGLDITKTISLYISLLVNKLSSAMIRNFRFILLMKPQILNGY